jgi:hypothetical protein
MLVIQLLHMVVVVVVTKMVQASGSAFAHHPTATRPLRWPLGSLRLQCVGFLPFLLLGFLLLLLFLGLFRRLLLLCLA